MLQRMKPSCKLLGSVLLLLSACSYGSTTTDYQSPAGGADLAVVAELDLAGVGGPSDSGPSDKGVVAADLQLADGLVNLPDGIYYLPANTSRLEHITSGNPDRCPYWSASFWLRKTGATLLLTSDTIYGNAPGIDIPVDPATGTAEASKPGMTSVTIKGIVQFTGGVLSIDVTYEVSGPGYAKYRWQGSLASVLLGATTPPPGTRKERLTWTDTNGWPALNTVDLLRDVAGNRLVSVPFLVGSLPMPMDTGMFKYTPPWDVCAGPTALVRIVGDTIYVSSKAYTAMTTLPAWFR